MLPVARSISLLSTSFTKFIIMIKLSIAMIHNIESLLGYNKRSTYRQRNMSAEIGRDGNVTTSQVPGEYYGPKEQAQVNNLPENVKDKVHENILTGQYVDKVYSDLMNSVEGKEYVNMLKRHGNGKSKPGRLEEIIVTNQGEGLVAATMPDYVKANIIINHDYIDTYCSQMASITGLSYDDVLKTILIHEMNHYFLQDNADLKKPEPQVEYQNDLSSIQFYMGLANKYPELMDEYVAKAKIYTSRYNNNELGSMNDYISNNLPPSLYKNAA